MLNLRQTEGRAGMIDVKKPFDIECGTPKEHTQQVKIVDSLWEQRFGRSILFENLEYGGEDAGLGCLDEKLKI